MKPKPARVTTTKRRARRFGIAAGVAVVGAAAAVTIVALRPHDTEVVLDPDLVAVATLTNETGDPTLTPLGRLAAERIAQGIQQQGVAEVAPPLVALAAAEQAQGASDRVRAFAEATGAGVVLHGAYYLLGDTLQFQVQITDAVKGTVLSALAPVTGPRERATEALGVVRERVLGALASALDFRAGLLPFPTEPPSLEVYRLFRQGLDAYTRFQYEEAIGHAAEALAMDSSYVPALFAMAWGYLALGRRVEGESVVRVLAKHRERMNEAQRLARQLMEEEDPESRVRHNRRLAEISRYWSFPAAWAAWIANRPREILEHLAQVDTANPNFRWAVAYWDIAGLAHHLLQDYETELEVTRAARRRWPEEQVLLSGQLRALAALGRIEDVEKLLDTVFALPTEQQAHGLTYSPVSRAEAAGLELRAHGHLEASRAVLQRAIEWLEARPPAEDRRGGLAQLRYLAEQWTEARALIEELVVENPDTPRRIRAGLAIVAARLGDTEEAQAISDEFTASELAFLSPLGASLAALRGENENAVRLLHDAYGASQDRGWFMILIHRSVALESLRGYPPFELFMRPRG